MLLKITEKIIRRNVLEQNKKKPSLSANQAFQQLRPVEHLYSIYLRARRTLAAVSSDNKRLRQTVRYHKPSKSFHNETQFNK